MNTNTTSLADLTVNEIIRAHPETVEIFNRFAIDACCGGSATLDDAAARDGADPIALRTAILDALHGPA